MAKIVDAKDLSNGKVKYQIVMDKEEALSLQGSLKDVHAFPVTTPSLLDADIISTGVNNCTLYFKVPREMVIKRSRRRKKQNFQKQTPAVSCLRSQTQDKHFFIYVVSKKEKTETAEE